MRSSHLVAVCTLAGFAIAVLHRFALASLERVQPEYVKLDVSLVRNVHRLGMNRRLIESLAIECRGRHRQVIAEGVEQQAERDTLLKPA